VTIAAWTTLGVGAGAFFGSLIGGGLSSEVLLIPEVIKLGLSEFMKTPLGQLTPNYSGACVAAGWGLGGFLGTIVGGVFGLERGVRKVFRPNSLTKRTKPAECHS
jgi:hypothetical protein